MCPSIIQGIKIRIDGASGCSAITLDFKNETVPSHRSDPHRRHTQGLRHLQHPINVGWTNRQDDSRLTFAEQHRIPAKMMDS